MRAGLAAWVLALALSMLAGAPARAADPAVRVELQGAQPVLVGQQVQVDVTVVAPNFFTSAPPFPALEVPGAIVTMPDERGQNGVEQAGGQTLATIRKSYAFTAQQAGEFQLPPVKIEFDYSGDDGKPRHASLSLPPTRITARQPVGAAASAGAALPVARLTVRQSFDRSTEGLRAGDALVRSIDIYAAHTQAMLIPPPHFEAPEGVRVFVADPVLHDESAGGRRTDRVTYVFEEPGRHTLPVIEVRWFDPATSRPASALAPAVTVRVAAAAHGAQGISPEVPAFGGGAQAAPRHRMPWLIAAGSAAGLLALAAVLWWARRRRPARPTLPRWPWQRHALGPLNPFPDHKA